MGFLLFFIQFFDQFQLFKFGEKCLFLRDEFLEFCLQFSHECDFLCYDCEFLCGLSVSGEFWSPRDLISMECDFLCHDCEFLCGLSVSGEFWSLRDLISMFINKCVNMLVDKFQEITIRKWNKQLTVDSQMNRQSHRTRGGR